MTITSDLTITTEVDGIELRATLQEHHTPTADERQRSALDTPQHRKTTRRISSPPAHDPGGRSGSHHVELPSDIPAVPTIQDLAKSFLHEEPREGKEQLEAAYLSQSRPIDDSIISDASDESALGTGTGFGLPAFLAAYLQRMVDRLTVKISNTSLRLDATLASLASTSGDTSGSVTITIAVRQINVDAVSTAESTQAPASASNLGRRHISLQGITLDLLGASLKTDTSSPLSPSGSSRRASTPSPASPRASNVGSQSSAPQPVPENHAIFGERLDDPTAVLRPQDESGPTTYDKSSHHSSASTLASPVSTESHRGRFEDAGGSTDALGTSADSLDIRAGEDSHSYTSRRTHSSLDQDQAMYSSLGQSQVLSESVADFQSSAPFDEGCFAYETAQSTTDTAPIYQESASEYAIRIHPYAGAAQSHLPDTPDGGVETAMEGDEDDPMAASVIYSQGEAASMYMSAMSQDLPPSPDYTRTPGHFPNELDVEPLSQSTPTTRSVNSASEIDAEDRAPTPRLIGDVHLNSPPSPGRGSAGPQATSALQSHGDTAATNLVLKHLISLDFVTIWLPGIVGSAAEAPVLQSTEYYAPSQKPSYSARTAASVASHHVPGTFSSYADMGASRRLQESYMEERPELDAARTSTDTLAQPLDIDLGTLDLRMDIHSLRVVHDLIGNELRKDSSLVAPAGQLESEPNQPFPHPIFVRQKNLHLTIVDCLDTTPAINHEAASGIEQGLARTLLKVTAKEIALGAVPRSDMPDLTFAIRRLAIESGSGDLLSFPRPPPSSSDRNDSPDILVKMQRSKVTIHQQPITDVRAWLRPVHLNVDLLAIDESLASFGGLSSVMELSASTLFAGPNQADTSTLSHKRGVRFQEDTKPPVSLTASPETKISLNLQSATLTVKAESCALELQCQFMKLSSRQNYLLLSIGNMRLYEPSTFASSAVPRLVVQLRDIKLEHLPSPHDVDLERLLSLITPSKNKYENDDDILLDTLLRQRKKGAILRVKITSVQIDVREWSFINDLTLLGTELSKFSAVTKYLPEDDRPGLLVLSRLSEVNARLPVTHSFGMLEVSCRDVQVGQISLPALVALSIGSIRAGPPGGLDILHELLRPSEGLPMIMMRMVGDEVEPAIKVKLFNLCLEYSVPLLAAFTGVETASETEKVMHDLATSIIDLAAGEVEPSPALSANQSDTSVQSVKRTVFDVLVHDCALGLKPRDSVAKGMLVFSNTKFSTALPPDSNFSATLELRKASLYIVDRESNGSGPNEPVLRPMSVVDRIQSHLAAHGFVSVSSIMAASAAVSIANIEDQHNRSIDVEVRDELFVLETCADSTQTLISILNGLSPPTLPGTEPKFRTEPLTMSVEDLLASITGEEHTDSGTLPAFFDAFGTSTGSDEGGLLASSLATTSNILNEDVAGTEGYADEYDDEDLRHANVDGLLDDDGYDLTDSTAFRKLSNTALWQSVERQCTTVANGQRLANLKTWYYNDQQLDKAQSTILGAPYRFSTPAAPFPVIDPSEKPKHVPFHLRVRDVHIIWNLYDGYDWEETRTAIGEAVEEVEHKLIERKQRHRRSAEPEAEEESVIGDCLFNSIYIGVPANRDAAELRRQISRGIDDTASESESYATSGTSRPTQYSSARQGKPPLRKRKLRLSRSKAHKVAFELKGVSVDLLAYAPGTDKIQSSVEVRARDFEIFDNVPTSTWRKFLTQFHDENNTREMMKPMIHIELLTVRPVTELAATEMSIRVSILPLRLHVDQDALDFITRFFDFKSNSGVPEVSGEPPFIQRLEVNTVQLCLDYKPKKVDYGGLRSGRTGEFKNFVILDRANINLKHAIVYGIRGFDNLHPILSDLWTPDVIRNQLAGVLAGVGPLRPLISLGAGVRDIVAIPVSEYKKDGRLVRSVQKGAFHFAKTTTAELARLGAKLAIGTQTVLSGVEQTLAPNAGSPSSHHLGWDDDEEDHEERRLVSNYADQPLGVLQGLRSAQRHLERDLLTARDAFIAVQGEALDAGSATGAAQAFARHAPIILLRPVIGASRAVGQTLMGVGNQVDRANVRRNEAVSPLSPLPLQDQQT